MKIFKAEPIKSQLNNSLWKGSCHKSWAHIRARKENWARTTAAFEFKNVTTSSGKFAEEPLPSPWNENEIVRFTEMTNEEIENFNYSIEGDSEIIAKG